MSDKLSTFNSILLNAHFAGTNYRGLQPRTARVGTMGFSQEPRTAEEKTAFGLSLFEQDSAF